MRKNKAIGIDIDAVLADSDPVFIKELQQITGKEFIRTKETPFKYEEAFGIDEDTMNVFWDTFTRKNGWVDIPVLPGAVEAVKLLHKEYHIAIVSARPQALETQTVKWLELNNIPFDEIFFTDFEDKAAKLAHLDELEYFLEDNPIFIMDLIKRGVHILLFDYPWNQNFEDPAVTRVFGWEDVYKLFFKSNRAR